MIETAQFTQPPPNLSAPPPNLQMPPPNLSMPPPNLGATPSPINRNFGNQISRNSAVGHFYKSFAAGFPRGPTGGPMTQDDFDGKRLRKSVMRKTVDYNAAIIKVLQNRVWQRDFRDRQALQPDPMYIPDLLPPPSYPENPINAVTTKFVKTATNKMRCPIFTLAWTPEGRRLVTGASSGEFTLWNGLTFNFETILQAHDTPVRTMVWSHNDNWMVTGDHGGYVKYWQSNMNNVKMFQAHKEPLRGISFSPTDSKFVSCSDDGTLRIWDFMRHHEERVLRGHGADVKCVHWHPQKGLIVSGSKDNQQPIKLWDPKSGQALATLHAHKSTVMDLKWNDNGNWLVTASRDHLLKLFDLRNMNQELQVFRGHKKEASSVAWHPNHEGLFCSGGSDGSILFWNVSTDKEVGAIDTAHDSIVWTLAWHPLGHILCSGSNDHTIKFWTRNRPGDQMRDKYNLNTLPAGLAGLDDIDLDEPSVIPGMGPDDRVESDGGLAGTFSTAGGAGGPAAVGGVIPGLDLDTSSIGGAGGAGGADGKGGPAAKKVPYAKPIPRNFQAQWNDTGKPDDDEEAAQNEIKEVITQIVENTPGVVPLQNITPTGIILYGKLVPVKPGSKLQAAIAEGPDALEKCIARGEIEELHDVMPHDELLKHRQQKQQTTTTTSSGSSSGGAGGTQPKRSRFSDIVVDHKPTFIYGDRYNSAPIIEQADFKLSSKPPSLFLDVAAKLAADANKNKRTGEDFTRHDNKTVLPSGGRNAASLLTGGGGNNGDNSGMFDGDDNNKNQFRDGPPPLFGRWSNNSTNNTSGGNQNNLNDNNRVWQNQPPPGLFNPMAVMGGANKFPPNFRPPWDGPPPPQQQGNNRPPVWANQPPPPRMDFRGGGGHRPFGPGQGGGGGIGGGGGMRGMGGPMRGPPPMRGGPRFGPRGGQRGRVRF